MTKRKQIRKLRAELKRADNREMYDWRQYRKAQILIDALYDQLQKANHETAQWHDKYYKLKRKTK